MQDTPSAHWTYLLVHQPLQQTFLMKCITAGLVSHDRLLVVILEIIQTNRTHSILRILPFAYF